MKNKLIYSLLLAFLIISYSSYSQQSKNKIYGSYGFQFILTDKEKNDGMIGPHFTLNYLRNNFVVCADAYAALTVKFKILSSPTNTVTTISNLSLMPGWRFIINNTSTIQLLSGLSYGRLNYVGEGHKVNTPGFGPDYNIYEKEDHVYIGLPIRLSYLSFNKVVPLEIYCGVNIHRHAEATTGISLMFGSAR